MNQIFFDIGLILALASTLAIIARTVRQPLIVGYILAGIAAGMLGMFHREELRGILDFLAVFGITFLLFLVGLELRFREIRTYGPIALITGVGQIVFTCLIGFGLLLLLNFSLLQSFYIALALTFSSTVIVVKLLTEKRDLDSLYGKVTVGFLLVQDAVAILALILVTAVGSGGVSLGAFAGVLLKALVLLGIIFALNRFVVPQVIDKTSKSLELLFIISISWVLLIASLSSSLGLSIEIGAFLAGISLANLPQEQQIASRVRPLRDLFIVFFFILLGLGLTFGNVVAYLVPIILLSVFILVGNPLIVMIIMGLLGFRKRTAFLSSVAVAQISEFSLILVTLGKNVGDLDQGIVDMVTAVGLITILGSSYLIMYSSSIYKKIAKYLAIFERRHPVEKIKDDGEELEDHVVLIGAGRLGWEILKQLQKQSKDVLVIEFNPTIVAVLKEKNINYLFGDITDPDIFESTNLEKAALVISTVFDPTDTLELLSEVKNLSKKPVVFVTAADHENALRFYKHGADYVIIPRVLSGHQVAHLLTREKLDEIKKGDLREEHLHEIREALNQFT